MIAETAAPSRRAPWLWLGFLLLGMLFFFHRMLWSGLHETVGDYVNQLLVNFILEHEYLSLLGRPDHAALWSPPVYFPCRDTLVFAETMLGAAPLYWPWRLLGFRPDTAEQLWIMLLPALNFATAWLLFRRGLRMAPLPAAIGAFLSAFGHNLGAQINNPQLHTLFYTYLALYFLCRLFRDPRPQPWVALGAVACLTAQLYACFYVGWFVVFFLGLAGLFLLCRREGRARLSAVLRANALSLAAAALLGLLALSPLLYRSLSVVRSLGWSNDTQLTLPHLLSWIYMGRRSILYFWLSRARFMSIPGEPEQRLGLGLLTTTLAALGFWHGRRDPWMRLLLLVTIALVVLTTELPGGASLWHFVRLLVPGARALRYVARVGVLLAFPAAVGVSAFFGSRPRTRLLLALLGLCLLEQVYTEYTFSKDAERRSVERYAAAVDPRCASFYLAVRPPPGPTSSPAWVYEVEIMLAQVETGIPSVNGGYTRFAPPGYGSLSNNVVNGPPDFARLQSDLAAWSRLHGLAAGAVCWSEAAALH